MGMYALFLAGSNYLAPVICGFIAQYHGWRWVFYWPSIFCGCATIFLFFCCEETNYVRTHEETSTDVSRISSQSGGNSEKPAWAADTEAAETGAIYTKKSYVKKLALWGPRQDQNAMFRRLWQCVYYLSWPVIFYAGYASLYFSNRNNCWTNFQSSFSYGSYLVFFNILNGTASLILGGPPYNFGLVSIPQN